MYPLLLETDQIHCYDTAGKRVDCMSSGPGSEQDAVRPKHLPPAAGRFQIQGALVRDSLSGALWTRNANPADFPLNWEEAHALVADMAARKAHGCADWQLPPRRLLFSLLSHQYINPALPEGHPFTNVFSGYYWTADTCHRLPEQAWHIHLGGGRVTRVRKDEAALVWPVCLPKTEDATPLFLPGERFAPDGDSVRDQLTGLIWSRNADPLGRSLPWEEALAAVDGLNRAAQDRATDWRMPNIRELESLVDLQADSPALPEGHPFANVRDVYWSCATRAESFNRRPMKKTRPGGGSFSLVGGNRAGHAWPPYPPPLFLTPQSRNARKGKTSARQTTQSSKSLKARSAVSVSARINAPPI